MSHQRMFGSSRDVVLVVVMVVVVVVVLRSSTLEFLSPVTLQHCLTSVVAEEAAVAADGGEDRARGDVTVVQDQLLEAGRHRTSEAREARLP